MTKNRHELPRKKPGRNAKDEIAEDLPTLEPVADDLPTLPLADDDLPTLEAIEPEPEVASGPVQVAIQAGGEANFDQVVAITVAAMDKKLVPDAVRPVLQRQLAKGGAALRHRRVLVRFAGDAMVGTAAKDLVAELLKPHVPLLAVVRRGFGDETVCTGTMPEVKVAISDAAGGLKIEVTTGELDPIDLPLALASHLPTVHQRAHGKKVVFSFTGKGKPDSGLRAELAKSLQAAGCVRAAIGERVLFDRELLDRVQCTLAGDTLTIAVTPADDEATTIDALSQVLPGQAGLVQGRVVALRFARPAASACDFCVEFGKKHGAERIELHGAADAEVLWPKLVTAVAGAEVTLRLVASGRSRAAVLATFRREVGDHVATTKGKPVLVDWPQGFAVDGEVETVLREAAGRLGAKALALSVGGEQREPFWPEPVRCAQDGDRYSVQLDSEAGKAAELQRAIDRRLPAVKAGFRGKAVRVQLVGAAAVSRTLLRALCQAIEAAGAMRLEVDEGGQVDVLLPPLLAIAKSAGDTFRITAMVDGRDATQQQKALARELEAAALPATAQVVIGPSVVAEALASAVLQKGVARLVLDGQAPVQLHPPLFGVCERKGTAVKLVVNAGADAAMVQRQFERERQGMLHGLGTLAGATVTLRWTNGEPASPTVQAVCEAIVGKKPSKVLLDPGHGEPLLLHPVAAAKPAPLPAAAPVLAAPSAAPGAPAVPPVTPLATGGGSLLTLLGRRDESVPPLVVLGVAAGNDPAHLAAVEAELQAHLPRFRGRSVLLVPRAGQLDVPVRKPDALVALLSRVVPTTAAATLVFRGPDAQGRPHFQVLQSTLRALPVGATFGDPRQLR
jgi:hypothetical protein